MRYSMSILTYMYHEYTDTEASALMLQANVVDIYVVSIDHGSIIKGIHIKSNAILETNSSSCEQDD